MELVTPHIRKGGVDTVFVMVSEQQSLSTQRPAVPESWLTQTVHLSQTCNLRSQALLRPSSTGRSSRPLSRTYSTSCLSMYVPQVSSSSSPSHDILTDLQLHSSVTPEVIAEAAGAGIAGVKLYPQGKTTQSGKYRDKLLTY